MHSLVCRSARCRSDPHARRWKFTCGCRSCPMISVHTMYTDRDPVTIHLKNHVSRVPVSPPLAVCRRASRLRHISMTPGALVSGVEPFSLNESTTVRRLSKSKKAMLRLHVFNAYMLGRRVSKMLSDEIVGSGPDIRSHEKSLGELYAQHGLYPFKIRIEPLPRRHVAVTRGMLNPFRKISEK
jgi:hypothetical protein